MSVARSLFRGVLWMCVGKHESSQASGSADGDPLSFGEMGLQFNGLSLFSAGC
jgi:hypothetical protein